MANPDEGLYRKMTKGGKRPKAQTLKTSPNLRSQSHQKSRLQIQRQHTDQNYRPKNKA